MKLISVTVTNYRVHKQITVEFDVARNVIGAPNEAGKSTLVEAVHHAFFLRSRITGAVQKAMLSELHPGHPTVELRFESGGRDYTITKVFTGNQSASTRLKEHGAGGRTLRDEQAEERIHEILQAEDVGGGRNIDSRLRMQWAHLWIWQGSATDDPLAYANTTRHAAQLRDRLARVEGGGVLESPLDAAASRDIAARYAATFTDRGKERSGSELDSAIKSLQAAEAAHSQAEATLEMLDEAVDAIVDADRTITVCDKTIADTREQLEVVRSRQREVAELAVRIAQEQAAADAAEAAYAEAVRTDAEIVACCTEIAALEASMGPDLEALAVLDMLEQQAVGRSDAATKAVVEAGQRQAAAAVELAIHDIREKHERLLAEHAGLAGRCTSIAAQRQQAQALTTERDTIPPVSKDDLATLLKLDRSRELAAATLDAIATRVEVLSASAVVTLGAAELAIGSPVTITGNAELAVGDRGTTATVRISPGGGRSLAEATQRFDEARAAVELALQTSRLESVDLAREAHARRQALDADIHAVNLAIEGLGGKHAEADLARLEEEIVAVVAEIERRLPAGLPRPASLAAAQTALAAAERELAVAGAAVTTATTEVANAKTHLEAVTSKRLAAAEKLRTNRAELDSRRTKAAVLSERHGADRGPRINQLEAAWQRAAAALAASRAKLTRLAPDDLELNRHRYERTLSGLTATKQDAETRRQLARTKLELEGTTDPRDDLARATARRRLAATEHARAVREAEAIKLLAMLFGEKKREVEEQFVAPLTSRVSGYLERLYGEGTTVGVEYKDGTFGRLTLSRRGAAMVTFEFGQLSAGAKEQVAAAFRLAMAEVLAEDHDGCLPIVFDDAFVNSDEDRHLAIQPLLDLAASRGLQVIVLACRPEQYATLGAKLIRLPDNPLTRVRA